MLIYSIFYRMDFNSPEEKQLVEQVFVNAMEALSEDDQTLPQVLADPFRFLSHLY